MKAVGYRETGSIDRGGRLSRLRGRQTDAEGARLVGEGAGRFSKPGRYENSAKPCSCWSST